MESFEKYSEREIIERILDGERNLYEIIVRRFNPYLYKTGRAYNYNHEDTQDLMQETFIDAYKNLSQFEGRADFKTWIIRIMLNNCYRKKEKSSFKNEIMKENISENATPAFSSSHRNTDEIIHNRELRNIIENALEEIPFDYRMAFSLREVTGLSISETAELLHISKENVKIRLNRAKTMLRKEIEKKYSPAELFEFNLIYCDAMVDRVMKRINTI